MQDRMAGYRRQACDAAPECAAAPGCHVARSWPPSKIAAPSRRNQGPRARRGGRVRKARLPATPPTRRNCMRAARARRLPPIGSTSKPIPRPGGVAMRRIVPTLVVIAVAVALPVFAQQDAHTVSMPDTLKWVEPPVLPGAQLAVVQGDPSKEGPFVYRLKMPAGYKVPPHLHKASENVTVLSGAFSIGI